MKRLHSLFNFRVETMALKDVNIIQLEAFQALLDGFENILSTQALLVDVT